ncbi:hypothetical protein MTO96_011437 [Rhipicephalus appendiculatus]
MTASRAHHVRSRSVGQLRTSSTSDQLTAAGAVRRSFLDEGCRLAPATECFFPTPHRGQSLTSFLSSADFGTCGELDRENAHIYVSEALIAAFEQMRKERLREKALQQQQQPNEGGQPSGGWCRAHAVATTSTSPLSSAYSSPCFQVDLSDNDDDIDEYELSDESNLSRVRECGLSLSLASLYSDADLQKTSSVCWHQEDNTQMCSSAEAVALNLLRRFSEKQLPKASDLQWLVSEQDAAQSLLPLPDAWPVSPDQVEEDYYAVHKMRLRGNSEWAPPREQIIFSMQPELRRKDQLAKQNYRCAGCGLRVNQAQLSRLRYYLYRRVKVLNRLRQCRTALHYLHQYILCCRLATRLRDSLDSVRQHLLDEPHVYSLEELEQARQGVLGAQLQGMQDECERHCLACPICTGRGFICEICHNADQLVFPFQLALAAQCTGCQACFHRTCFVPGACPKCRRLETRYSSTLFISTSAVLFLKSSHLGAENSASS